MRIYTKTGDKGETSLFGGKRVSKHSLRIEAYGTVDELNSSVGVCRSLNPPREIDLILDEIQHDLFTLGADLATPVDNAASVPRIQSADVSRLEAHIDAIDPTLDPLTKFILPSGTQLAAALHVARTVCRRAERCVVQLAGKEHLGEQPLVYLNRLADLLFVLARYANRLAVKKEQPWESKR